MKALVWFLLLPACTFDPRGLRLVVSGDAAPNLQGDAAVDASQPDATTTAQDAAGDAPVDAGSDAMRPVDAGPAAPPDADAVDAAPDAPPPDAGPPDAGPCPGYTAAGGGWYLVESVATSFASAEAICATTGGHLVVIGSAAENTTVRGLTALSLVFVGLQDPDGDHVFAWVDGSPLGWSHWSPGQPDGQACVAMVADGTWWALSCGLDPLPYICECNT